MVNSAYYTACKHFTVGPYQIDFMFHRSLFYHEKCKLHINSGCGQPLELLMP